MSRFHRYWQCSILSFSIHYTYYTITATTTSKGTKLLLHCRKKYSDLYSGEGTSFKILTSVSPAFTVSLLTNLRPCLHLVIKWVWGDCVDSWDTSRFPRVHVSPGCPADHRSPDFITAASRPPTYHRYRQTVNMSQAASFPLLEEERDHWSDPLVTCYLSSTHFKTRCTQCVWLGDNLPQLDTVVCKTLIVSFMTHHEVEIPQTVVKWGWCVK